MAVAMGGNHIIGLRDDGTVAAVGEDPWGLGYLNVSEWTNIKAIAGGVYHTVGLKGDGTVVAVGDNSASQLNVSDWTNITALAAGWFHTVGLTEDGTVVAEGNNSYGQLNITDWTDIRQPVCIESVGSLTALPGYIETLSGISPRLLNSLLSKADNSIAAFERGDSTAMVNILNALLNEVAAQSGKGIDTDTAAALTTYIQNLINSLQ